MLKTDSRILIIDDFETVRMVLKRCLGQLGYTVMEEASDGQEGLDKIKQAVASGNPYELVFSDVSMPNLTGLELLETVHNTPELSKTPFVMVTSESEQKFITQAFSLGVVDYIVKPFSPATLQKKLEKIREVLTKS